MDTTQPEMGNTDSQTQHYALAHEHYKAAQSQDIDRSERRAHLVKAEVEVRKSLAFPKTSQTPTISQFKKQIQDEIIEVDQQTAADMEEAMRLQELADNKIRSLDTLMQRIAHMKNTVELQLAMDEEEARRLQAEELEEQRQVDLEEMRKRDAARHLTSAEQKRLNLTRHIDARASTGVAASKILKAPSAEDKSLKDEDDATKSKEDLLKELKALKEGLLCKVCYERKVDAKIDCGHACMCIGCANKIANKKCPVCKILYTRVDKLYL